jgi:site-specific DNA recombinase
MKAVIIARVSTEEQKEAGLSLPAQVMRLENYCQNRGFSIIRSFSFDESAYKDDRSEFDQIFNFILEQKEKIVVCCDKVDRLSRNMFDKRVSYLYDKALRDEIELHFTSDGQIINSKISAAEKFHFSISLGLAKYYSDAISDNVKRAIEQKWHNGEVTSKAPYGYRNIRIDGKATIIVEQYEQCIVQKVFELYATGAFSMDLLCKKINREYDLNWSTGKLDFVLKNKFYYGIMTHKNKEYPHKYPTTISSTLFEQVQQVKASFNKKPVKYAGQPYIYRGLIRCADCGLAITPEKHKGHVYYHCTQYNGKHGGQWLREEEITRQLGLIFKSIQVPKDILDQIITTLNEVHQNKIDFHNKHFDRLTKEHKETTKMLDNLYLDKLKMRITESDYDRFYSGLRDQLAELNNQLSKLQEAEDNYYITAKYVLDLTTRAHDLFQSSEVEEKRQLIKLLLSNLRLSGKNLVFDAEKPFDLLLNCSDYQAWCAR